MDRAHPVPPGELKQQIAETLVAPTRVRARAKVAFMVDDEKLHHFQGSFYMISWWYGQTPAAQKLKFSRHRIK
jgi:hypothetical protein